MDADAAELALAEFEDSELAKRYPAIAPRWRRTWNEVIPFRDDPPEGRKLILLPPRLLPAVGIGIARKRPRLALPDACVIRAPAQAADCP